MLLFGQNVIWLQIWNCPSLVSLSLLPCLFFFMLLMMTWHFMLIELSLVCLLTSLHAQRQMLFQFCPSLCPEQNRLWKVWAQYVFVEWINSQLVRDFSFLLHTFLSFWLSSNEFLLLLWSVKKNKYYFSSMEIAQWNDISIIIFESEVPL